MLSSLIVGGGLVEGGGIWSVCGWMSGGRQGDLWLWLYVEIYWLGLPPHTHEKHTHWLSRSRLAVIFITRYTHCTWKRLSSSLLSILWTCTPIEHAVPHFQQTVIMHFRSHKVTQADSVKTTLCCRRQWQWQIHLSLWCLRAIYEAPGVLGCWGGHCVFSPLTGGTVPRNSLCGTAGWSQHCPKLGCCYRHSTANQPRSDWYTVGLCVCQYWPFR